MKSLRFPGVDISEGVCLAWRALTLLRPFLWEGFVSVTAPDAAFDDDDFVDPDVDSEHDDFPDDYPRDPTDDAGNGTDGIADDHADTDDGAEDPDQELGLDVDPVRSSESPAPDVAFGVVVGRVAAEDLVPRRGELPEGYVTASEFARLVVARGLQVRRDGTPGKLRAQSVYTYARNAPATDPFPLYDVVDSAGVERRAVKVDEALPWWERKNTRVEARRRNAEANAARHRRPEPSVEELTRRFAAALDKASKALVYAGWLRFRLLRAQGQLPGDDVLKRLTGVPGVVGAVQLLQVPDRRPRQHRHHHGSADGAASSRMASQRAPAAPSGPEAAALSSTEAA
jgi:hypothetical protein